MPKPHRHPLPTGEPLGRHALLALTAESDGLYTSLTRLVSFGPPPAELVDLVRLTAEVDAAMLFAARPGRPLSAVLAAASMAYADRGFPEEWRRHHQGGITGYRGREVFATPHDHTPSPNRVRWHSTRPSRAAGSPRTPRSWGRSMVSSS